jgi:hypothetical protein
MKQKRDILSFSKFQVRIMGKYEDKNHKTISTRLSPDDQLNLNSEIEEDSFELAIG